MRDVLLLKSDLADSGAEFNVACSLARRLEGRVTGLFVVVPATSTATRFYDAQFLPVLTEQTEAAYQRARAHGARFRSAAGLEGCADAGWQVVAGPLATAVAAVTPWHDVLVLKRDGAGEVGRVGMVSELLMAGHLPTLVVPDEYPGEFAPAKIAVAFNDSPESVRALRASLPLLRRAERVLLLQSTVPAGFPSLPHGPDYSASRYLAQYELPFVEEYVDGTARHGEILERARAFGADLLVMGAFGRSRAAEWLLGGATRDALDRATIPVLFAR